MPKVSSTTSISTAIGDKSSNVLQKGKSGKKKVDTDDSAKKRDLFWTQNYNELLYYKAVTGSSNPPQKYKSVPYNGTKLLHLGQWCDNQRRNKKLGKLDAKREERLTVIGFKWDPKAITWENKLEALIKYKRANNGNDPPQGYETEDPSIKLGHWCNQQRRLCKKGTLQPSRAKKLEDANFSWTPWVKIWEDMFAALKDYHDQNGGKDPTVQFVVRGDGKTKPTLNLGYWCKRQREARRNNKLTQERIDRLDSISFKWLHNAPPGPKKNVTKEEEI